MCPRRAAFGRKNADSREAVCVSVFEGCDLLDLHRLIRKDADSRRVATDRPAAHHVCGCKRHDQPAGTVKQQATTVTPNSFDFFQSQFRSFLTIDAGQFN